MPTVNRTSEVAEKILHYIEDNDVVTWHARADESLREVLLKYQKMEKVLQKMQFKCLGDAGGECLCDMLDEALSFDPLS